MHILVVDDDSLAGEMTGAILEDAGHHISLVDNGIAALEILATDNDIDLVLSDMNMPFISGLELFHTLREQANLTPFILLTGDDPATLRALEPRLNGCLTKDSALEETLAAAIQVLIQGGWHD